MGFTYEYEHPLPLCCDGVEIFELYGISMKERHSLQPCPVCHALSKKIISRVHLNEIFPGSTKQQNLADKYTRMSQEAQEEGFQSKDELDTAIGLAKDRAKQMDQPDKQLIGPVESPFEHKYKPSADEFNTAGELTKKHLKAVQDRDARKMRSTRSALSEYEQKIKENTKKGTEFKPKNKKTEHIKEIKSSRERRGSLA